MTGWRLGYLISNDYLINGILKLQQNSITCPSTFSQFGAIEAVKKGSNFIKKSRQTYEENRNILLRGFGKMSKIKIIEPQGGLYAFIDISAINKNSYQFCTDLLRRCKVSAVPGISFGKSGEGYIRICLATDKKNIIEFIKRIKDIYI
jgi:aspartate/methionine/tyrosine aminotransferase